MVVTGVIDFYNQHYVIQAYESQNTELKITNAVIKIIRLEESTWLNIFLPNPLEYLNDVTCLNKRIIAYSIKARDTKEIQAIIQLEMAVIESVFGDFDVMLMNKFTRTRINVINSPILPGTISGGITKLI